MNSEKIIGKVASTQCWNQVKSHCTNQDKHICVVCDCRIWHANNVKNSKWAKTYNGCYLNRNRGRDERM